MDAFQIPASNKLKESFFKALADGSKDMDDFVNQHNLSFNNGFPLVKWAFMFHRLYHDVQQENIINLKCKRGPWPLVLELDEKTGYLYAFMKKSRFEEVQEDSRRKSPLHYIEALTRYFNVGISDEIGEYGTSDYQILLDLDINEDLIEQVVTGLLGDIKDKVKRIVIVTFVSSLHGITDFTANITNEDLSVIYQENWNPFIDVNYTTEEGFGDGNEHESDDIELPFREEKDRKEG